MPWNKGDKYMSKLISLGKDQKINYALCLNALDANQYIDWSRSDEWYIVADDAEFEAWQKYDDFLNPERHDVMLINDVGNGMVYLTSRGQI